MTNCSKCKKEIFENLIDPLTGECINCVYEETEYETMEEALLSVRVFGKIQDACSNCKKDALQVIKEFLIHRDVERIAEGKGTKLGVTFQWETAEGTMMDYEVIIGYSKTGYGVCGTYLDVRRIKGETRFHMYVEPLLAKNIIVRRKTNEL